LQTFENNEVRKIQYTGRSTYVLSLPKRWVNELKLKAGDPVTIMREANNSLSIVPNVVRGPSTYEATSLVTSDKSGPTLKRTVVSMYLRGFNIMHLKSKAGRIHPSQRDSIREVVRRNLIGTEIIADSSDMVTIQVLLSLPELSINTAVRRMFLIGSSMHRDAISTLAGDSQELYQTVIKSDDEDRFSLYVLRNLVIASQNESTLKAIGLKSPADCLSYSAAVRSLERIADHASEIALKSSQIGTVPEELRKRIIKMSDLSLQLLNDSIEAFLRKDYYLADSIVDKSENIRTIEDDIITFIDKEKNPKNYNNIYVKLILEHIRRTAEYSFDIAEAAMNQIVGEVIEIR
jgi:phosphate uptake regulator